jgi:hypothetical protein
LQAALGSLGLFSQATPTPSLPADSVDPSAAALDLLAAEDDQDEATDVTEVLAALGFIPVPISLPQAPPPAAGSETETRTPGATATVPLVQTALTQVDQSTVGSQSELPMATPSVPNALLSQMTTVTTQPEELPFAVPSTLPASASGPAGQPTTQASAVPPVAATTTTTTPQTLEPLTAQAAQATPEQQRASVAEAPPSTAGQLQPIVSQTSFGQNAGNGAGSSSDEPSTDSARAVDVDRTASSNDAPLQAFANVAATVSTQPADVASDVDPAHVASQIAHQADLYRLPGGRGVRIELNPEDLGGVGVTIKYGASGGIELHIVAEQAATAQLVQSGWNDLRGALGLQGIAPERLIMSVSSPSESSSSGSGGQAIFGQAGQSNHQQSDRNNAQANRGWAGFGDAPTNVTEDVRQSGVVSSSRIDYRV